MGDALPFLPSLSDRDFWDPDWTTLLGVFLTIFLTPFYFVCKTFRSVLTIKPLPCLPPSAVDGCTGWGVPSSLGARGSHAVLS